EPQELGQLGSLLQMFADVLKKRALLNISQTLGDQKSNESQFTQEVISPTDEGILASILAPPGASRLHSFKRRVDVGVCPVCFVCVQKQIYQPRTSGSEKTYCYYEASTGQLTTVPYSPSPKAKQSEFAATFGTYPDYTALIFAGRRDDCPANLTEGLPEAEA